MKFKKVNINGAIGGYGNFISIQDDNNLLFMSKDNFEILGGHDLDDFLFAIHFYNKKLILSNLLERHFEVLPDQLQLIEYKGPCYPISRSGTCVIEYCPKDKMYNIKDHDHLINTIGKNIDVETNVYKNFLIECNLHQSTASFVRVKNLITGNFDWQIDYNFKILRCIQIEKYLVLDCKATSGFTIIIDIETGQECWRQEMTFSKVDKLFKTVLFGGEKIWEMDLATGTMITEVEIIPYNYSGCIPHFVDDEGIYYLSNDHSFGKVNRTDGIVLWEFDLIDGQGAKRKLSNWLLLGNGNLVLQSMPNHPNGDLTCIFNPRENMEFSKVKNSVRIS